MEMPFLHYGISFLFVSVCRPVAMNTNTINDHTSKIAEAAKAIKGATFFLVGAGAGMSADSGLATYSDVSNVFEYFKKNKYITIDNSVISYIRFCCLEV